MLSMYALGLSSPFHTSHLPRPEGSSRLSLLLCFLLPTSSSPLIFLTPLLLILCFSFAFTFLIKETGFRNLERDLIQPKPALISPGIPG